MFRILKTLIGWKVLIILSLLSILFFIISQPGYSINNLQTGNKTDKVDPSTTIDAKSLANNDLNNILATAASNASKNILPRLSSTADIEPYAVPVVIKSEQQTILSSLMDGYIDQIAIKEGDSVKKGQLLIDFDCKIQTAQYDKGIAQLEQAKATHAANMRLKTLGAISDPEVEKSKFAFAEAVADLAIKKELVSYCKLNAPFDGYIVKTHVKAYQSVNKNIEMLELLSNDQLRLELIVPSNWLSWLNVGNKFKVDIAEVNKNFNATVTHILPKIDAVSQTVRIIADIDGNTNNLIAGMNGKAFFNR